MPRNPIKKSGARANDRASLKAACDRIGKSLNRLVNPADLFSGAKLEDAAVADNIIIFKRTSPDMLRPRGVTHNYHHRYELVVPLQKTGRIHVDGVPYQLTPGMACLIFPHQFHHYLDIEKGPIKWVFVTFEMKNAATLRPLRNSPRKLGAREIEELDALINEYASPAAAPGRGLNLVLKVSDFLQRLAKCSEADCVIRNDGEESDTRGAILEKINAYVRSHLGEPVTISDLAAHTGYSISYLRAIFRKNLGVSLGSYMRESRLLIAASMLGDPNRGSIEEISRACGFESIHAFSRAFKNAMGMAPRAYGKFVQTNNAKSST
ncbi:AraC-like DNA-binding protein [Ereboglobus sp. PH5-10]|uniref:helix-turn-helix transcriptional regulator n=1 Tax=Ereboglobus sp. PH5-10 TaxID=2940629 RepID=UPI002406BA8E|nr:AraC family transcriptional regulator [Ereboglobus sp. PH5-10]MDF9826506.1 AraC-like DNA-binding protein [Ereboglobus sp. PH5-10]